VAGWGIVFGFPLLGPIFKGCGKPKFLQIVQTRLHMDVEIESRPKFLKIGSLVREEKGHRNFSK